MQFPSFPSWLPWESDLGEYLEHLQKADIKLLYVLPWGIWMDVWDRQGSVLSVLTLTWSNWGSPRNKTSHSLSTADELFPGKWLLWRSPRCHALCCSQVRNPQVSLGVQSLQGTHILWGTCSGSRVLSLQDCVSKGPWENLGSTLLLGL